MNPVKATIANTRKFVSNHKVAFVIVATAAVTTAVVTTSMRGDIKELNEFLEEKNLTNEFYNWTEA